MSSNVTYVNFETGHRLNIDQCLSEETLNDLAYTVSVLKRIRSAGDVVLSAEDQYRFVWLADVCEEYLTEFERIGGDQHWNETPVIEVVLEEGEDHSE